MFSPLLVLCLRSLTDRVPQSSAYDLAALKALDRPLRPFFVSPASTLSFSPAATFTNCHPVVCASASKLAEEADGLERELGFTYVQGSGDECVFVVFCSPARG